MTLITAAYIKNAQINSGTYINLLANSIRVSWEIFTGVKGTPTRSLSDSFDSRLGRGIYTGFNNPTVTIQGNFTLNTAHVSGASATMDYEYLKDIAERGDVVMTLKCDIFKETGDATGEINVMVKNISFGNSNSNLVDYTLNVVEVNSNS